MAATVNLNGAELTLDPAGAVWWAAAATLVAADLHLDEAPGFARAERLLPPHDARATIERLAIVLRRYRPARVVVLDRCPSRNAGAGLSLADRQRLDQLAAEREWLWIGDGGEEAFAQPPLVLRHAPAAGAAEGEICGSLHPKAAVRVRGRRISGRAFVTDGRRLVLPAFGAVSGGLDALDPAIAGLFHGQVRVYLIGREAIYLYAAERLEGVRRPEPAMQLR